MITDAIDDYKIIRGYLTDLDSWAPNHFKMAFYTHCRLFLDENHSAFAQKVDEQSE